MAASDEMLNRRYFLGRQTLRTHSNRPNLLEIGDDNSDFSIQFKSSPIRRLKTLYKIHPSIDLSTSNI